VAQTKRRTGTRTGAGHRHTRQRECARCRDNWHLVSIPKPFRKLRRRWRRFVRRSKIVTGLAMWGGLIAIVIYVSTR
jgi:hypothetical protein